MKINKLNESACWFGKYFDKDGKKKLVYISKDLTGDADEADKIMQDMIPEPFTKFVFGGSVDSKMAESEGMTLLEKKLNESEGHPYMFQYNCNNSTFGYDFQRYAQELGARRMYDPTQKGGGLHFYTVPSEDVYNKLKEVAKKKFTVDMHPLRPFDKDKYSDAKVQEAMVIGYDEGSIKEQIRILEKNIEDYKQLIIDEPEDKDYWEEQIKKCEEEIADLQSYKPLNEDDNQEILYIIRDSKGNQLSAPNPDDNELWDRVASMEARGRRGLCVVVYTGKKVNESTRSLGEEDFIEVDDPSVVDKLDYAGAVEVRGNKVYADANTLKQLKNDMDNLTEAKIFGAKGKKELKEAGEVLPIEVPNQDGTPKQYDIKVMDLERLPGKLNWDVADQLQDHFRKNNLWVDELHYNQANDRIEFDINWGDWKHEHLRAKWLLQELFETLGIKAEIRSHTTEEDGTDTYSAHYVVYSIG